MEISFDPVKSEKNRRERGLPFERAAEFDFDSAITLAAFRNSEMRWEAFGYLYDRLHLLCYKQVDNRSIRVISFRKANAREAKRHGLEIRRRSDR